MARPTKLTPETQARIVEAIRLGATYELASKYAGVTYQCFRNWMNAGEKASTGPTRAFRDAVLHAEGRAALSALAKVHQAAQEGTWQAATWLLERRYREDYGRTITEHTGTITLADLVRKEAKAEADATGVPLTKADEARAVAGAEREILEARR